MQDLQAAGPGTEVPPPLCEWGSGWPQGGLLGSPSKPLLASSSTGSREP